MVFDCHIHVGAAGRGTVGERVGRMLEKLDRNGVDGVLVLPLDGLLSNCTDHAPDNDFVAGFCAIAPGRLKAAFSVNPLMGERALAEIRRCRDMLGLRVLKLHPWLQGFSISSDAMNRVAALCEELGVVILFHDGTPPYSTPLQVARVARDFTGLQVVSGHCGLNDLWPDAIAAARRYPNFSVSLCGVPYFVMQRAVEQVPASQITMGSDFFEELEDLLWYRWAVWRSVAMSDPVREEIECRTPVRLFGEWS
jgi:uncharacterized protein